MIPYWAWLVPGKIWNIIAAILKFVFAVILIGVLISSCRPNRPDSVLKVYADLDNNFKHLTCFENVFFLYQKEHENVFDVGTSYREEVLEISCHIPGTREILVKHGSYTLSTDIIDPEDLDAVDWEACVAGAEEVVETTLKRFKKKRVGCPPLSLEVSIYVADPESSVGYDVRQAITYTSDDGWTYHFETWDELNQKSTST